MGSIAITVIVWFLCLGIAIWTSGVRHKYATLGVRFTFIAMFLGWLGGKALLADLCLWLFPQAFPMNISAYELALPRSAIEIVAFVSLFALAVAMQGVRQRIDDDPLAELKRIESDKKRWMEANGE